MKNNKLFWALSILGILLCVIAPILFATPFIERKFGSLSNPISGFELMQGGEYVAEGGSGFAIEVSFFVCLGVALVSLMLPVLNHLQKTGKIKPKLKPINGSVRITLAIIFALIPFIINLMTLKLTGYADNPLAHLGGGAIASGLLVVFGATLVTVSSVMMEKQNTNEDEQADKE